MDSNLLSLVDVRALLFDDRSLQQVGLEINLETAVAFFLGLGLNAPLNDLAGLEDREGLGVDGLAGPGLATDTY